MFRNNVSRCEVDVFIDVCGSEYGGEVWYEVRNVTATINIPTGTFSEAAQFEELVFYCKIKDFTCVNWF